MVIGKINVTGTRAYTTEALDIPQGIVGAEVAFDFSADWAGLTKNVVFVGAKDVEILDIQDSVYLPPEVVSTTNINVRVGVVGLDANKKLVIPTLWADLGTVKPAAPVDMGYDPTLPIWAQLMGMIGDLRSLNTEDKSNLVAAVNEAMRNSDNKGPGGYYTPVVTQPTVNTMMISFIPSVATMPTVEPVTIMLPGSDSGQNPTVATVEPAEDDIPKIFFDSPLQQTKDEAVTTFHYRSKTLSVDCYAEIKAQGNSTLMWPKKNQTVKLYEDAECTKKLKINFKGWGKQNKFVIKANWRDLTHVRDIVSVRLEGDCLRCNPDYDEFPELLKNSPNMGGIDGFPVVVYAAGVYQGRFMWNIPKDKWMTNMDDELDEHCILCSEDYNSGCFRKAANINGGDWTDEIHDTVPVSIKTRWNEVISFVMNSTDEEFVANLDSYIKVSTLIDRHLMGLLSCDFDGYGKNQLYITYDGQQWYADRYDKDGTWGNYWTGNAMLPSDYGRERYEDFTSTQSDGRGNLLFIRLEQLFWERLQTRWAELRTGALSIPNIINRFRELYDIAPPHLIEEDYANTTANGAFTGIPNTTTCTIQQIQRFAVERHAWMDEYISSLVYIPCAGISLDAETLTFTAEGSQTLTATVTPDNCTDAITWESDNASVATVDNGVVTAIANGSAVITATCGRHSASCAVSVSGIAEPVPCTGITLDKTELTFTEEGSQTIVATVTPADTTDPIVWSSDNEAVARVENGVVMTVFNGSANITATCGKCSASCTVTVSGIPGTEYLYQNYNSNGAKFSKSVDIDFAAGDYIEAEIDLSTCAGDTKNIFSVGESITAWAGKHYHVYYSSSSNSFQLSAHNGNAFSRGVYQVSSNLVVFRVDKDGIYINGELLTAAFFDLATGGGQTSGAVYTALIPLIAAMTNVTVGATEGSVTATTYKYIKVVRH